MVNLFNFIFSAQLKEVVGPQEIDGWDLDADEEISEIELMEVDASQETAIEAKVTISITARHEWLYVERFSSGLASRSNECVILCCERSNSLVISYAIHNFVNLSRIFEAMQQ